MSASQFHWGFGIEDTFIGDPYAQTGKILDEYELTGHYRLWKSDFDRLDALGADSVRWGIPWYRIQPSKNKWDWSFADEAIPYITQEKKLTLVLDLMHYGVPTWMEQAFVDPDYPAYVEEYTQRAVERYGRYLRFATPFNEPHTACDFCGRQGVWPPYLTGYEGYFRVLRGVVKGAQRQTKLLQQHGIACVQVECSGGSYARCAELEATAELERLQQVLYFHCLTGDYRGVEPHFDRLARYGLTQADWTDFHDHACAIDVMGVNFYPQFTYQDIDRAADGSVTRVNHPLWTEDLVAKIRERYARFRCPIMVTETSVRDHPELKRRWLDEATRAVFALYREGLPVYGFFWFPILDMYDWEYRVQEGPKENFKACFGFYDQQRNPNECAERYRKIINGMGR